MGARDDGLAASGLQNDEAHRLAANAVARELAPTGLRSGPKIIHSNVRPFALAHLRLLRSRAGASSLATESVSS